jgi:hypothetical protein
VEESQLKLSVLLSFAEKGVQRKINKISEACVGKAEFDLFVDSGAFSVKHAGKEIKIDDYIHFIYDNADKITTYANLDVIGEPGASKENQRIMEAAGLSPLPVVHFQAEMKEVYELASWYPYIGIGGPGPSKKVAVHRYFTQLAFTVARKANKGVRIHGFGITSPETILQFPYYSADSTSWVNRRYGDIRLYNPRTRKMYVFPRRHLEKYPKRMELFRETISYYGLPADAYMERKRTQEYNLASIKAFVKMAAAEKMRIYLARMEVETVMREGFFDYIFGDFTFRD